jgi:hypothetical protein
MDSNSKKMSRKEFVSWAVVAGGTVALAPLAGCGGDGDGDDGAGGSGARGGTGTSGGSGGTAGGTGGSGGTAGGTGGSAGGAPSCTTDVEVVELHTHTVVLSGADVEAGVEKTYTLSADPGHTHTVVVTPADFADLANGTMVMIQSSTDEAHSHEVHIECM